MERTEQQMQLLRNGLRALAGKAYINSTKECREPNKGRTAVFVSTITFRKIVSGCDCKEKEHTQLVPK